MKHIQTLLFGLLVLSPAFSVSANPQHATGCEAKRQDIEKQINYARTHGNKRRLSGLEKSLAELNTN